MTGDYLEGSGTANAQRSEAKIMGKGHLMMSLNAVTDRKDIVLAAVSVHSGVTRTRCLFSFPALKNWTNSNNLFFFAPSR